MADRITDKHLESMCARINAAARMPLKPWVFDAATGKNIAQIGNYHISGAYGGVQLHQMHNAAGGVSTPLNTGYVAKRELYNALAAFLAGLEFNK